MDASATSDAGTEYTEDRYAAELGEHEELIAVAALEDPIEDTPEARIPKRKCRSTHDCPLPVARPHIEEGEYARANFQRRSSKHALKIVKPHCHDAVFWAAVQVLEAHNKIHDADQTLAQWADPLCIEALSACATPMLTAYDTIPVVHVLTRHELFVKLQLQLVYGLLHDQSQGVVMVLMGDHWEPLAEFVKTLPPSRLRLTGASGTKLQYLWWKSRKQPFRFTDLIRELRKIILLHAIGERVTVDPNYDRNRLVITLVNGHNVGPSAELDYTLALINPMDDAVFRLNKDTALLAREALWATTTKVFVRPNHLKMALGVSPTWHRYLRRVELAFDNDELITYFRIPFPGCQGFFSSTAPEWPHTKLSNLTSLIIRFRSTINKMNSPWWSVDPDAHPDIECGRKPCQKMLHEMVLPFIVPHLNGVPRVYLEGYIKAPTKRFWENLFASASTTDHSAFIQQRQKAIRALPPSAFPPICQCAHHCGEYTLVDELENWGCPGWQRRKAIFESYQFDFEDGTFVDGPVQRGGSPGRGGRSGLSHW